jgi:hypothetical protein
MQTHDLGAFSKRKIFASHHAFNEPSTLLFSSNISTISWRPVLVVEEARVPGENH